MGRRVGDPGRQARCPECRTGCREDRMPRAPLTIGISSGTAGRSWRQAAHLCLEAPACASPKTDTLFVTTAMKTRNLPRIRRYDLTRRPHAKLTAVQAWPTACFSRPGHGTPPPGPHRLHSVGPLMVARPLWLSPRCGREPWGQLAWKPRTSLCPSVHDSSASPAEGESAGRLPGNSSHGGGDTSPGLPSLVHEDGFQRPAPVSAGLFWPRPSLPPCQHRPESHLLRSQRRGRWQLRPVPSPGAMVDLPTPAPRPGPASSQQSEKFQNQVLGAGGFWAPKMLPSWGDLAWAQGAPPGFPEPLFLPKVIVSLAPASQPQH